MLDLWFSYIDRTLVKVAEKSRHSTEQSTNLKPAKRKSEPFQMEPVVKSKEKVQVNFTWAFNAKKKTDAHLLVDWDNRSKFPTPKVVRKATADLITKFMQRYITNCEVPRKLGCVYTQNKELKRSHFRDENQNFF